VYVDAVLPPPTIAYETPPSLHALLDALPADDGLLPPWPQWWPAALMRDLVPDERQRTALAAEVPRVPRAFYDEPVALPAGWWDEPAGYLQLSAAYDAEREDAAARGWPTSRLDGAHLDVAVRPDAVADAVRSLVAAVTG
jgi:hypothetical protein